MKFGKLARAILGCVGVCVVSLVQAGGLQVLVQDGNGVSLPDAVVYALPESGPSQAKPGSLWQIEQIGRKFSPLVTVLQTGSEVSFPNNDTVRHHVYSFSSAKKFEVKLYSGVPADNITFDKAGTVVLGCNIHDKMIAYIHVVDTPYFAKSDVNGRARIESLPKGKYQLRVWHYNQVTKDQPAETAHVQTAQDVNLSVKLATRAVAAQAPTSTGGKNSEFIY